LKERSIEPEPRVRTHFVLKFISAFLKVEALEKPRSLSIITSVFEYWKK